MRWITGVVVAVLLAACASSSDEAGSATTSGGGASAGATKAPADAPAGMVFADPGVHPFADVAADAQSTFAVDVDTASYTMARRYITDGQLPPPTSVRVEEFVNFFDQQYAPPEEAAFAISADGAPTPFLTHPDNRLLRIGIQSRKSSEQLRRRASLTFVVDVSGSMAEDNRLGLVRDSLGMLVERLRPSDSVAIVAYSDNAWVVLKPTPVSRRARILSAIEELRPHNATNVEAGLTLGYRLASNSYAAGDINRVVLASDGIANVGVAQPEQLLRRVGAEARAGIQLVTVGVGMGNYNDVMLEQLADNGDGFYAYVDSFAEAQRVFSETVTSTLDVVALDAKIQVEFTDAVKRYRLLGFENRAVRDDRFRDDAVAAGAVGPGHAVTALYEVTLTDPGPAQELATVRLRWTDPATDRPRELQTTASSDDLHETFAAAPATLRLDATAAAYAEILRRSPHGKGLTLEQIAGEAATLTDALPKDRKVAEFAALVATAAELGR